VKVTLFVPTLDPGAVGMHTLHLQRLLRDMGVESDIYAEDVQDLTVETRHFTRHRPGGPGEELIVYQSAIGSVTADYLRSLSTPLVVNYHNITPAAWFDGWHDRQRHGLRWGRAQLRRLAERAELGISDSAYNRAELVEAGYRRTAVAPVLFDLEEPPGDGEGDERAERTERGEGLELLFVGRIAPNKAQHDLIKALAVYRRLYDPRARLSLVGGVAAPRYRTALEGFVEALGLGGAVTLTGAVAPGVLTAHYRRADVFVCLSEHEGFCVPLLEAMHHGLPVIAHAAAAVPETLAGAGVLLADKSPATVAAAIHTVVADAGLRRALVAAGRARLEDFRPARTRARYVEVFEDLLGSVE
jgi:glycosyltransferase involved in cell wall biosynthesis